MELFQMPPPDKVRGSDTDYIISYIEALRRELEVVFSYLEEKKLYSDAKKENEAGEESGTEEDTEGGKDIVISPSNVLKNESETFVLSNDGAYIKNGDMIFDNDSLRYVGSKGAPRGFVFREGDLLMYSNGSEKAAIYASGNKLCIDGEVYINGVLWE